jgi:hypothetical protein
MTISALDCQPPDGGATGFYGICKRTAPIFRRSDRLFGNPFFYHGRPADDPHSEAKFTGYASHEPGLRLMKELHDVWTEIQAIKHELRAAGLDPN